MIIKKTDLLTASSSRGMHGWGWGCSSVGGASDRHVADTGSIPRCGKGFFSQSQLSVQTLLQCTYSPVVDWAQSTN